MTRVVFGTSLVFHGFPSRDAAALFVDHVADEYGRDAEIYDDPEAASDAALFPFELEPPAVLVARDKKWTQESEIEADVIRFGGKFAGT